MYYIVSKQDGNFFPKSDCSNELRFLLNVVIEYVHSHLINQPWHFRHCLFQQRKGRYFRIFPKLDTRVQWNEWCRTSCVFLGYFFLFCFFNLMCGQITWWRHQMEIFSALLAICAGNSPVPGEFPTQRPVTRSFDVYFDLRPNKRLSKQS